MKYDFETIVDRRDTCSVKWDVKEGELPLWIADMDFRTAPEIVEALKKRAEEGIYGYTYPERSFFEAYISFWKDYYGFEMKEEWMAFATGVVPILSSSVRKFTSEGDKVVLLTPNYNIFFNSVVNNKRIPYEVPLIYRDGEYFIDFEHLEQAFADEKTKMLILCNPANPVSRIWTKEELARIGELAEKYGVVVLSDEIHGPITRPGTAYVPYASVNEVNRSHSITAISPSKAFNLAGIQSALLVVPDEELRKKAVRQINTDEVAEPNVFASIAARVALTEGRAWYEECRKVLFDHRDHLISFVEKEIPVLKPVHGDATYLVWIDVSALKSDAKTYAEFLRRKTGLFVQSGEVYGKGGEQFIRINVASPSSIIEDALKRLKEGTEEFLSSRRN
jgi:cystathionine beta-lyase